MAGADLRDKEGNMWNKVLRWGLVGALVLFTGSVVAQEVQVITLRAFVIGPGVMGVKKATNLELAADYLNRILEASGVTVRVQCEVEFSELTWAPFADKFYLDFRAGKAPDIVTLRETADLAAGGFIVPMTQHIESFWSLNYYDFHAGLWEGARWQGEIWGVPHDISPVGIWYRKDVLRKLGYTDAQIAQLLPEDGNTTIETLARLAKEAVDAKLVEYGILHRPSSGPGMYATLLAFGVECYDPEMNTLVLDKPDLLRFLKWHQDMVEQRVIPSAPPPWATIHGTFVEGKTFSTWASHVGTPSEWMAQYGLSEEALEEDLGFLPFPPSEKQKAEGLGPVSVHDFPLYFVTTQCAHPDLAMLLIMLATSPEACAIHSEFTLRPPYRDSALDHPLIKENAYIQRTAPSAVVVRPVPIHPQFWAYMGRVFEALKGVEAGVVTPERALQDMEAWFGAEIPAGRVIP
ncbi:extracellular solute-binding protein [Candidatus Bipolaricaulota bacterium]|nr:extracellular solute-binding protein [Candidatus Bipolaricaulota bacterium]